MTCASVSIAAYGQLGRFAAQNRAKRGLAQLQVEPVMSDGQVGLITLWKVATQGGVCPDQPALGGSREGESFVITLDERLAPWLLGHFMKICVSVNSEAELLALHARAHAAGVLTALIQDAGRTEFGGVPTYTAIAVGPDRADRVDAMTGELPLF